jgi:hypothetical protein
MKIIHCDQGSEDWIAARSGCITASMFSTARSRVGCLTDQQQAFVDAVRGGVPEKDAAKIAGYKTMPRASGITRALAGLPVGEWSDASKDYAFRLAVERISGEPLDEGFQTWAMARGHELEPDARMEHEMQTGLIVQEAGFITTDDDLFGASADGLIGEDGGAEYKCFLNPSKLRQFHIDNDASEIFDQAQGCMWITGRKWWHIGLYCPALASIGKQLWWKEFARDDNYINAMEQDLWEFAQLVASYEYQLKQKAA